MPNDQQKIHNYGEYDLIEICPGNYIKTIDGEVVGKPNIDELQAYKLYRKVGQVDSGIIEVALALAGVAALLTSGNYPIFIRILATSGFLLCSFAAGILCFYFVAQKIPWLTTKEGQKRLFAKYFHLLIGFFIQNQEWRKEYWRNENELAYLSLLAAFCLIWSGLVCWVFVSYITSA